MEEIRCPRCEGTGKIRNPLAMGNEMRQLRIDVNLPMKVVAKGMHISISYLHDLETGKRPWNNDLERRFKSALS